jgi:hypothetical protein
MAMSDMSRIPGTPDWIKSHGKATASAPVDEKPVEKVVATEEGKDNPIEVKNDN